MCTKFDSVSEISPEKETWTIMARVVRLWLVAYFNVIGLLIGVGTEREIERNGIKIKLNVICLEADRHRIECTLFGFYVDELNTFLAVGDVQNVVVIVEFGKVKTFKEKIHLQNCMNCTKLVFNPTCAEVVQLRNRMNETMESPTQGLSQLIETSSVSLSEDFLQQTPRRTIEGLKDCKEDSCCVALATVKHIVNDDDWYPYHKMSFCEKCKQHVMKVFLRYCIKVRVIDETDSATFVIFDLDAMALFNNKTCADMFEAHDKRAGQGSVPNEINGLVDKSFLFKVECRNEFSGKFEQSFRIKKV